MHTLISKNKPWRWPGGQQCPGREPNNGKGTLELQPPRRVAENARELGFCARSACSHPGPSRLLEGHRRAACARALHWRDLAVSTAFGAGAFPSRLRAFWAEGLLCDWWRRQRVGVDRGDSVPDGVSQTPYHGTLGRGAFGIGTPAASHPMLKRGGAGEDFPNIWRPSVRFGLWNKYKWDYTVANYCTSAIFHSVVCFWESSMLSQAASFSLFLLHNNPFYDFAMMYPLMLQFMRFRSFLVLSSNELGW